MKKSVIDLSEITHAEIMHVFDFDFENGKVYWKNPSIVSTHRIGKEAGWIDKQQTGRRSFVVGYQNKVISRGWLVYFAFHKKVPLKIIDHVNGDSLNWRIRAARSSSGSTASNL